MAWAVAGLIFWTEANLAEPAKPTNHPAHRGHGGGGDGGYRHRRAAANLCRQVSSLWLQVQGLEYPDLASVRVNHGAWISLNNRMAIVAEPGRSYGGIGGAFATLEDDRAYGAWFRGGWSKPDRISLQSNKWNGERLSRVGVQLPGAGW